MRLRMRVMTLSMLPVCQKLLLEKKRCLGWYWKVGARIFGKRPLARLMTGTLPSHRVRSLDPTALGGVLGPRGVGMEAWCRSTAVSVAWVPTRHCQ